MPRRRAEFPPIPMPIILPLVLVALVLGCASPTAPLPAEGGVRVLFIGNSLTYTNDLPATIAGLARAVNDTPFVYRTIAKPNYALEDHYFEGVESRIRRDGWEVVVMQQGPSRSAEGAASLYSWGYQLALIAQAVNARPAFYEVWPGGTDSTEFVGVRTSYRAAADRVAGMFIPAGEAFLQAMRRDPTLVLYQSDQFHPSRVGTYLAALVHFEMLYGRPATDLPDLAVVDGVPLNLPVATVQMLQEIAHAAVVEWGV